MKRSLPAYLLMFLLTACLGLSACIDIAEDPESPSPTPSRTPASIEQTKPIVPQDGGTLKLSMRTPLTLNPLLNEDYTVDCVLKLIFEPLTVLDENLKPASHLAAFNFSSDYTSVSLSIRDDAIWSDGMPVTSDDLIFTIDFIRSHSPENAIYKHSADNIASCEKIDGKTVKITFVEVFGGSGYLFDFPIIPQHYYKNETNPSSAKNMSPLGNGLYMYESYTPLKSMGLNQSAYTFRNRAYIDSVEVIFVPDAETELYAFEQGLTDVLTMEITEWSKQHSVKQIRYEEFPAMYYEFIGFNFNVEILNNFLFREALAHSLNLNELIPAVYLSHAERALTPVNPASWVYDTSVREYTYDTALAKSLLEQVRHGDTEDTINTHAEERTETAETETGGTETAEGETQTGGEEMETDNDTIEAGEGATGGLTGLVEIPLLRIMTNKENDERVKIATALSDSMAALGLEVQLEILPFDEFYQRLTAGDFDLFVGGYNLSVIPDLRFAFHTDSIETGTNLLAYSDPILDRHMDSAFSAYSENAYAQALSVTQQRIAERLPVISLAFRKSAVLTDTRIYGNLSPSSDNIFANMNKWFLAE